MKRINKIVFKRISDLYDRINRINCIRLLFLRKEHLRDIKNEIKYIKSFLYNSEYFDKLEKKNYELFIILLQVLNAKLYIYLLAIENDIPLKFAMKNNIHLDDIQYQEIIKLIKKMRKENKILIDECNYFLKYEINQS